MSAHRSPRQVTNVLIRFIWVIYIPSAGPDFYIRAFIGGLLEVCRRALWNFCRSSYPPSLAYADPGCPDRLENEHLGNVDQYRVTREVPLPYSLDDIGREIDDEDDDDEEAGRTP